MKIKNKWLLERVESIYPDFKNGVDRIFNVPPGADAIQMLVDGYSVIIKMEKDLHGDDQTLAYSIAFKYGVLCVQDWR
jgi:hypothetical protein